MSSTLFIGILLKSASRSKLKMFALALIFGVLLLSKVEAFTHEQEAIAQFGVGSLGPGYTYQKIKKYRTQVTLLMF